MEEFVQLKARQPTMCRLDKTIKQFNIKWIAGIAMCYPLFPKFIKTFTALCTGLCNPKRCILGTLLPRNIQYNHVYWVPHVGELQIGSSTTMSTRISIVWTWIPYGQQSSSQCVKSSHTADGGLLYGTPMTLSKASNCAWQSGVHV